MLNICYTIISEGKPTLSKQKGGKKMTNEQFKIVLEMIIKLIEESKDTKEAAEKIKELLENK